MKSYSAHETLAKKSIPENGEAVHPRTHMLISYVRSAWFSGRMRPPRPGVYERIFRSEGADRTFFSFWNGEHWSGRQKHPNDLVVGKQAGTSKRSSKQHLPWRGLKQDPDAEYITYVSPPGTPRTAFDFGGYVRQKEQGSPLVKVIHVAKKILSADGDYLTACGYRAHKGEKLELWGQDLKIKVVHGLEPDLCLICKRIAFSERESDL